MKRHLFTVAIFVAALALYSIGMVSGAMLFFAAGAIGELWFWARVLGRRKGPGSPSTHAREARPAV